MNNGKNQRTTNLSRTRTVREQDLDGRQKADRRKRAFQPMLDDSLEKRQLMAVTVINNTPQLDINLGANFDVVELRYSTDQNTVSVYQKLGNGTYIPVTYSGGYDSISITTNVNNNASQGQILQPTILFAGNAPISGSYGVNLTSLTYNGPVAAFTTLSQPLKVVSNNVIFPTDKIQTVTVTGSNSPASSGLLSQAVQMASVGATINVGSGTFAGNIDLPRSVTFARASNNFGDAIISVPTGGYAFKATNGNLSFNSLTPPSPATTQIFQIAPEANATNTTGIILDSGSGSTYINNGNLVLSTGLTTSVEARSSGTLILADVSTTLSNILISGGTTTINTPQTLIGNVTVTSGTFTNNGTLTGTLAQSGGASTLNGSVTVANLTGGNLTSNSTIGTLAVSGGTGTLLSAAVISSTVNVSGTGTLVSAGQLAQVNTSGSGSFTNSNVVTGPVSANGGTLLNTGTLANLTVGGAAATNNGTVTGPVAVTAGSLALNQGSTQFGNFTVSGGTLTANAAFGGTLTQTGGLVAVQSAGSAVGPVYVNGGSTTIAAGGQVANLSVAGGSVVNSGTITGASTPVTSGNLTLANGSTQAGSFTVSGGALTANAAIGGTLAVSAGSATVQGSGSVSGITTVSSTGVLTSNGALGTLSVTGGQANLTGGTATTLSQTGGTVTSVAAISGTAGLLGGTTTITAPGSIGNTTTVSSSGNLTSNGTLQALNVYGGQANLTGGTATSLTQGSGTVTNSGNITGVASLSGGTTAVTATGIISGTTYVNSGGNLTSAGTLNVLVVNNGQANLTGGRATSLTQSGGAVTSAANITGTVGLTGGTTSITAAGIVGGTTTVNGGSLTSAGSLQVLAVQTGTATLTGGTATSLTQSGGTVTSGANITGTVGLTGGTTTITGAGIVGGTTTVNAGNLTSVGSLQAVDVQAGRANLTGGTATDATVSGGTLVISGAAVSGTLGVSSTGTANVTGGSVAGTTTTVATLNQTGGTLAALTVNSGTSTLTGGSVTGVVTVNDGVISTSGSSNLSNTINVNNGTATFNGTQAGPLNVNGSAAAVTLLSPIAGLTTVTLSSSTQINSSTGNLLINGDNANVTFSGVHTIGATTLDSNYILTIPVGTTLTSFNQTANAINLSPDPQNITIYNSNLLGNVSGSVTVDNGLMSVNGTIGGDLTATYTSNSVLGVVQINPGGVVNGSLFVYGDGSTGGSAILSTGGHIGGNVNANAGSAVLTDSTVSGNIVAVNAGSIALTNSTVSGSATIDSSTVSVFLNSQIVGNTTMSGGFLTTLTIANNSTIANLTQTGGYTSIGDQFLSRADDVSNITGYTNVSGTGILLNYGTVSGLTVGTDAFVMNLFGSDTPNATLGGQILGTVTVNGGNLTLEQGTVQTGAFTVTGGTLTSNATFGGNLNQSGGVVAIQSGANLVGSATVSNGTLTNDGLVSGALSVSGGSVTNNNTLASTVSVSGTGSVTLTNVSTQSGNFTVSGGTLTANAAFGGSLVQTSGAVVVQTAGNAIGPVTANGGTLDIALGGQVANLSVGGGTVTNCGTINGATTSITSGAVTLVNGSTQAGNFTISGGTLTSNATIGGTLDASGGSTTVQASGAVGGTTTVSNTGSLNSNGSLQALAVTGGQANLTGGTATTLTQSGGTVTSVAAILGTADLSGGTTTITAPGSVGGLTTVSNTGNLTSNGTLHPLSVTGGQANLTGGTAISLTQSGGTVTSAANITGSALLSGGSTTITAAGIVGGNIQDSGNNQLVMAGTLSNNLIVEQSATALVSGNVAGTTVVTQGGCLTLTGTLAGTLTMDQSAHAYVNGGGRVVGLSTTSQGAQLVVNGTASDSANLAQIGAVTNNGGNVTIGTYGNVTGAALVTAIGAGMYVAGNLLSTLDVTGGQATIYGTGTVAGNTTVNGGTLTSNGTLQALAVATGTATLTGGTATSLTQSGGTVTSAANITGTADLTGGTTSITGAGIVGGTTTVNGGNLTSAGSLQALAVQTGTANLTGGTATSLTQSGGTVTSVAAISGNAGISGGTATINAGGSVGGATTTSGTGNLNTAGNLTTLSVSGSGVTNVTGGVISGAVSTNGTLNISGGTLQNTLGVTGGTTTATSPAVVQGTTTVATGTLTSNASLQGVVVSSGTVNLTGGSATGLTQSGGAVTSAANIMGTVGLTGGTTSITGAGIVGGTTTVNGGGLTSAGTLQAVDVQSGSASLTGGSATVVTQSGGTFASAAAISSTVGITGGNATISGGSVGGTTTVNSGTTTLAVTGGTLNGLTLTSGTANVTGGSVLGTTATSSTLNINTAGTVANLTVNTGTTTVGSGGTVTGTISALGGTTTLGGTQSGTLNVNGATADVAINTAVAGLTTVTLSNSTTISHSTGALTINGAGANVTIGNGSYNIGATTVSASTLTVPAATTLASLAESNGTVNLRGAVSGTAAISGGTLTTNGTITGATTQTGGTMNITGGTYTGGIALNGGTLITNTGNSFTGSINASGAVVGTTLVLPLAGTVNQTGNLTLGTNLATQVAMQGTGGSGYNMAVGKLISSGTVALAGSVTLPLFNLNGSTFPNRTDSFSFITGSSVSGAFVPANTSYLQSINFDANSNATAAYLTNASVSAIYISGTITPTGYGNATYLHVEGVAGNVTAIDGLTAFGNLSAFNAQSSSYAGADLTVYLGDGTYAGTLLANLSNTNIFLRNITDTNSTPANGSTSVTLGGMLLDGNDNLNFRLYGDGTTDNYTPTGTITMGGANIALSNGDSLAGVTNFTAYKLINNSANVSGSFGNFANGVQQTVRTMDANKAIYNFHSYGNATQRDVAVVLAPSRGNLTAVYANDDWTGANGSGTVLTSPAGAVVGLNAYNTLAGATGAVLSPGNAGNATLSLYNGTYAENLNLSSYTTTANLTVQLVPDSGSYATVNLQSLSLGSKTNVVFDADGTTAANQVGISDKFAANGSVSLGSAALVFTPTSTPAQYASYELISNANTTNAVSGSFAGVTFGQVNSIGGTNYFATNQFGADQNDVGLIRLNNAPIGNQTQSWVNASYTGSGTRYQLYNGDYVYAGVNAYPTVQGGVNSLANGTGSQLNVANASYAESVTVATTFNANVTTANGTANPAGTVTVNSLTLNSAASPNLWQSGITAAAVTLNSYNSGTTLGSYNPLALTNPNGLVTFTFGSNFTSNTGSLVVNRLDNGLTVEGAGYTVTANGTGSLLSFNPSANQSLTVNNLTLNQANTATALNANIATGMTGTLNLTNPTFRNYNTTSRVYTGSSLFSVGNLAQGSGNLILSITGSTANDTFTMLGNLSVRSAGVTTNGALAYSGFNPVSATTPVFLTYNPNKLTSLVMSGVDGNDTFNIGRYGLTYAPSNQPNTSILGGAGDDSVTLLGCTTNSNATAVSLFDGGTGTDTLTTSLVSFYSDFQVTGTNSGNLTVYSDGFFTAAASQTNVFTDVENLVGSLNTNSTFYDRFVLANITPGLDGSPTSSIQSISGGAGYSTTNPSYDQLVVRVTNPAALGSFANLSTYWAQWNIETLDPPVAVGNYQVSGSVQVFNNLTSGTISDTAPIGSFLNLGKFYGGDQNDLFNVSGSGNKGILVLDGGAGVNTLDLSEYQANSTVDLTNLKATPVANSTAGAIANITNVFGTGGNDYLYGDSQSNILDGNGGNDTILGNAGNDILLGDYGADSLVGGAGNDFLTGDYVDFYYGTNTNGVPASIMLDFLQSKWKTGTTTTAFDNNSNFLDNPGTATTVLGNLVLQPLTGSNTASGSTGTIFSDNSSDQLIDTTGYNSIVYTTGGSSQQPWVTNDVVSSQTLSFARKRRYSRWV